MVEINILWHAMQLPVINVNPLRASKWNFPLSALSRFDEEIAVGVESMKEIRENFLQRWTISSLCIFYSTIFFYRSMDVRNFINGLILAIERYYRENRDSRNWSLNGKWDEVFAVWYLLPTVQKASSAKCGYRFCTIWSKRKVGYNHFNYLSLIILRVIVEIWKMQSRSIFWIKKIHLLYR